MAANDNALRATALLAIIGWSGWAWTLLALFACKGR